MPRFAANLSMMYPDLPFLDRFAAAAQDGFSAVEYLFPYAFPAAELAARLKDHGLQQVLFNTPSGGTDTASFDAAWAQGSRGTASVPGREAEFRAGFEAALTYAAALDCPRVHAMVGLRAPGDDAARPVRTDIKTSDIISHQISAALEEVCSDGLGHALRIDAVAYIWVPHTSGDRGRESRLQLAQGVATQHFQADATTAAHLDCISGAS